MSVLVRALTLAVLACLVAFALPLTLPRVARADDAARLTEEGSAVDDGAGLGVSAFARYNKGAAREVSGVDIGYRFPLPDDATLVVVRTPEGAFVHVDAEAAEAVGFNLDDDEATNALWQLIIQLDEDMSRGGLLLADIDPAAVTFTSEDEATEGAYRYVFCYVDDGRAYCAVQPATFDEVVGPTAAAEATGLDLSDGALWVDGAQLVSADDVVTVAAPSALDQIAAFFSSVDYRPFWVSLRTSALALVITFVLGLLAAWRTMGSSSRLKGVLDSVFTIPMVLPPTVCGFLLLLLFGQATPIGRWFIAHGIALVFTWPAAVISAVVVSFPLMYRTALGAFEALDTSMLDAARTLGWSEGRIFRTLMLPLAWPSIAAGTVLAFARAMGEFGCTLFFAGNYAGMTQTIPLAIYFEWMSGDTDVALFWVVVVILFSFLVVLFINLYTARSQRFRARGGVSLSRARRARRASGDADGGCRDDGGRGDDVDDVGGDALRIDRDALSALLASDAPQAHTGRR